MAPEPTSAIAARAEPERGCSPERMPGRPPAWWLRAGELAEAALREPPRSLSRAAYRLGDAILDLDADAPAIAAGVHALFAECAVADPGAASSAARVRCSFRSLRDPALVLAELEAAVPLDGVEMVRSLIEPRPGAHCFERASPREGWRLLGWKQADEPLAAIQGGRMLLDVAELPADALRNLAASAALRAQTGVLFLHAASLSRRGAALLLAGRGGAGKTTLALTLATRGFDLLGDDLAALRTASGELLPLRRTLHIRHGLRAALVDEALRERRVEVETQPDARRRALVEPRSLFPDAQVGPGVLGAAFFLRGFRKRPAAERFVPSLAGVESLRYLPIRLQWGIAPARRLLRFAQAVRCLARVPCYFLDVGRPEETADLIESTVEAS